MALKVHDWAFQWKMSFLRDPKKQAHWVIFSAKSKRLPYPPLVLTIIIIIIIIITIIIIIIIIIMSLKAFLKNM